MNLQAFLITFREALEALLIVGVIIMYLKRIDQSKWTKWVWLGVILALISSYGVALLFQVVLTGYHMLGTEIYLKIGIMLISTILLTHMVLFITKQSQDIQHKVQARITHILTVGSILNMIIHSYLVVLREGVETVFFFAAISNGDIGKVIQSPGALYGLIAAIGVGLVFFRGTRKIPLHLFFKATSVFMILIAAGLFVQAIGILQDRHILGSVYKTAGGELGEVYNIEWFMPEHPTDYEQYVRDYGEEPLFNGQIGIFMKAFLGYTHNPSAEEFAFYWLYYMVVLGLIVWQNNRRKVEEPGEIASAEHPPLYTVEHSNQADKSLISSNAIQSHSQVLPY
jgi:high-affinity iron transporter